VTGDGGPLQCHGPGGRREQHEHGDLPPGDRDLADQALQVHEPGLQVSSPKTPNPKRQTPNTNRQTPTKTYV